MKYKKMFLLLLLVLLVVVGCGNKENKGNDTQDNYNVSDNNTEVSSNEFTINVELQKK